MKNNEQGPRIYNLFPPLVGSIKDWQARLGMIRSMAFNWVFLNPFHYPGFSGSLYAVKDYYRLNPLFQGDDNSSMEHLLKGLLDKAKEEGLSVMMDLVINHSSKDSDLVSQHPSWYVRDADGEVISPSAVNPDDPEDITVWSDLAAFDYSPRPLRKEMTDFWKEVVLYYTRLGFQGFRCDAAYQIPGDVWKELISASRAVNPKAAFFAETLGAQLEEVAQLSPAGFDYFFNSAKWWDFKENWLLEQYEKFRRVAPSIAFPESHDTERVAAESGGNERESRFRYLFSAFFSTGVMMPIGYEYGFRRKLHVVDTRPQDWEEPTFDISDFIRAVNEMKAGVPVLNEEGPQECFTPKGSAIIGLLRQSAVMHQRAAALINPHKKKRRYLGAGRLAAALETDLQKIREITPQGKDQSLAKGSRIHMAPRSIRVFLTD